LFAQSNPSVVDAGYTGITVVPVAPGQVTTVFVTGIGNVTEKVSARNAPLPNTLGGISATLIQIGGSVPAPIMSVFPFRYCYSSNPPSTCASITAITLQIPFELNIPTLDEPPLAAYLQVSDAAGHTAAVVLSQDSDAIHVLRSTDTILAQDGAFATTLPGGVVTHSDGTPVDALHPAQVGEELVMYAVGLGLTSPAVPTGSPSPSPAVRTVEMVTPNFDYRPNAPPSPAYEPSTGNPPPIAVPAFVGLTPGFVGLYQVNFTVPAAPAGLPACVNSARVGGGANSFAFAFTNLTVTLTGANSFDGAAICVGPAAI
jgi:hypothetical protein